jgi:hypothetical protein
VRQEAACRPLLTPEGIRFAVVRGPQPDVNGMARVATAGQDRGTPAARACRVTVAHPKLGRHFLVVDRSGLQECLSKV